MNKARFYGEPPFRAALLHGGPGAPGEMAPVARRLSSDFSIAEPLQTAHALEGQVEELGLFIEGLAQDSIILAGWSWGAWLAFIYTALNPEKVSKLILISAGAFEDRYVEGMVQDRLDRLQGEDLAAALQCMAELNDPAFTDKDASFKKLGGLLERADMVDPVPYESEALECSYAVYRQVWTEAAELRSSGDLLKLAGLIRCPVTAIHGDRDPHPYLGVEEPLSGAIPDLRFILLSNCGHHPWYEMQARDRFFEVFREELTDIP